MLKRSNFLMSPSGDTVLPEDSIVDLILLWLSWSHTLTASSRLFFHSWSSLKASNSCLESMTDEDLSSSTLTDWLLGNLVHKHVLLDRLKLFILASVAVANLVEQSFFLHHMQSHLTKVERVGTHYSCLHAFIQWCHAGPAGFFIHLYHQAALAALCKPHHAYELE